MTSMANILADLLYMLLFSKLASQLFNEVNGCPVEDKTWNQKRPRLVLRHNPRTHALRMRPMVMAAAAAVLAMATVHSAAAAPAPAALPSSFYGEFEAHTEASPLGPGLRYPFNITAAADGGALLTAVFTSQVAAQGLEGEDDDGRKRRRRRRGRR